jgi:hypothetical protein
MRIPEPGTRIALVRVNDPYTRLAPGTHGTAGRYSDIGGLNVTWDDGSRLSLIPSDGDEWRVL